MLINWIVMDSQVKLISYLSYKLLLLLVVVLVVAVVIIIIIKFFYIACTLLYTFTIPNIDFYCYSFCCCCSSSLSLSPSLSLRLCGFIFTEAQKIITAVGQRNTWFDSQAAITKIGHRLQKLN